MNKKSLSLTDKLNSRFKPDQDLQEATDIIFKAKSGLAFNSLDDFESNLVEGSLLNVSVIASRALSVPQGEYLVWMTDAGHTMLVPTELRKKDGGVYEHSTDAYEVQTKDLMANWNRLERVIAENSENLRQGGNQENLEEPTGEPGDEEENQAGEFRNTIDTSTVDRKPILRAMQNHGFTVSSLANEVGVDPPAISRILRTPKDVQGDPGGRNPSMGLASQICNVLRIDPTAAFPDIFNQNEKYQARQQSGNEGSGSHSHGKGGDSWTRGNVPESNLNRFYKNASIFFENDMAGDMSDSTQRTADNPVNSNHEPEKPLTATDINKDARDATGNNASSDVVADQMKAQQDMEKQQQVERERMLQPQFDKLNQTVSGLQQGVMQRKQAANAGNQQFGDLEKQMTSLNTLLGGIQKQM